MKMQARETSRQWMYSFMEGCHEMSCDYLKPYIQKMFENCHLALLEFADKAESGTAQIRFMEAGTIIRENRDLIEQTFYKELAASFSNFTQLTSHRHRKPGPDAGASSPGVAQMSLLSKEDTDLEVALQNMIAGAILDGAVELTGIRQRLTVLNNGHKLEDEQIPAGPAAIALAFHEAGKELVLEHESRLVVYLLFEKFVLRNTRGLYEQYNKRLLKAGLLQNLKYGAVKNPRSQQPKNQPGQTSGQQQIVRPDSSADTTGNGTRKSISDELFGNIMELMSRRNQSEVQSIADATPKSEIVSAIQIVQENIDAMASAGIVSDLPTSSKLDVDRMVENLSAEREQLFRDIDRRRLPAADTQMIDLVGMMFEYMLKDEDIPNAAKAEMSRLHTPYLKVAILDKTFFTNNNHTAHLLLNNMARAAARWVYEDYPGRGIFPTLRKIVSRILLDFREDLSIFDELQGVLNSSLDDLEDKAARVEQQSRQAAEGRDKLDIARARADSVLNEAVSRFNPPGEIRELLGDVWNNKLTFIYLRDRDTDSSDSWKLATETIESILRCTEPCLSEAERQVLEDQYAETHDRIEQSLHTLSAYGNSDVAADMTLIRIHTGAALAGTSAPAAGGSENESARVEPSAIIDAATQVAADTCETESPVVDSDADDVSEEPSPACLAAMETLDEIPFGTWFSIQQDPQSPPVQARLSWHSRISGNYMFVDSMGVKMAVMQRLELAGLLASGQARINPTEHRPLIHRALEKIRTMLGSEEPVQA